MESWEIKYNNRVVAGNGGRGWREGGRGRGGREGGKKTIDLDKRWMADYYIFFMEIVSILTLRIFLLVLF